MGSEGELARVSWSPSYSKPRRREGFKCDEAVIPVSADRFLDYSPIKSMPWEEDGFVVDVRMSEEEEVELFKTPWLRGLNGMSLSKRLIVQ